MRFPSTLGSAYGRRSRAATRSSSTRLSPGAQPFFGRCATYSFHCALSCDKQAVARHAIRAATLLVNAAEVDKDCEPPLVPPGLEHALQSSYDGVQVVSAWVGVVRLQPAVRYTYYRKASRRRGDDNLAEREEGFLWQCLSRPQYSTVLAELYQPTRIEQRDCARGQQRLELRSLPLLPQSALRRRELCRRRAGATSTHSGDESHRSASPSGRNPDVSRGAEGDSSGGETPHAPIGQAHQPPHPAACQHVPKGLVLPPSLANPGDHRGRLKKG
eukprot:scaffold238833_cov35-Tisochrysis_lutea.AAC.2